MNKRQNIKKRSFFASKNKVFKVMGGATLAAVIGVGAVLGLMPLSTNISAAHQNAATSGPQGAQGAAGTADSGLNITSNPFNLNPQSDPTLFTTQSGINIKFGGATGTFASGGLTGYSYVTMGTYNGSPVNWVIIGYNSSLSYLFSGEVIVGGNVLLDDTIDNSPAGEAIKNNNLYSSYGVQNDVDLQAGELLVISQGILGTACFDADESYTNDYNSSDCELRKAVEALYNAGLGFNDVEKSLIKPKTLTNYNTSVSVTSNAYMFPLAARGENFNFYTYLTIAALKDINNYYWLRSGQAGVSERGYDITKDGVIDNYYYEVYIAYGVRPAMVLKLF